MVAGEKNTAPGFDGAALHDAYAADYDEQVRAYDCYLAEALFGLAFEFVRPGERLLDVGIGSGLSAAPFAQAGLRVSGMDFAPAMLDLCRAKGIADDLRRHDLRRTPWPYASRAFDHAVACGVFHFLSDLETIFDETARVVQAGGVLAFTTKGSAQPSAGGPGYVRLNTGGLDTFDHDPGYVASCIERSGFARVKALRCFVSQDIFTLWIARKREE
jgi:predicted TPR repeat methyltransferase